MRAIIRFLTRGAGGTVEQRDKIFEGDAITLGRATDQVLHLKDRRVELEHARIFRRGDRVLISSPALAGVTINGAVRRDAALAAGDVVVVGSNTLRFIEPPQGFDLAFTFELEATARAAEAARTTPILDLADTRLAKRPWAWSLFIVVALVCLVVPSLGMKSAGVGSMLRTTALPDDGWWIAGALSPAHRNIGTSCESCHALPFVRVRDAECLECHGRTLHAHGGTAAWKLRKERCTSCHLEHNEPTTLVRNDSRSCVACHADLEGYLGEPPETASAVDFATAHPEFRLTLELPYERPNASVISRLSFAAAAGQDTSGLKFPHDVHMDPRGIQWPNGTATLSCGDCHRPEEGGARMQPIEMERHCLNCHRLDFEPADPQRTVPHGDAGKVLQTLVEYYSARYLEEYPDPHATALPSRPAARPGVELSQTQRARALERARTRAFAAARDLFERRTCHECHTVTAGRNEDGSPTWVVAPTVLTRKWMPAARFSHAKHSTTLTGCSTCHSAAESAHSSDVLMPAIATCRECHGGSAPSAGAANKVRSDCALCHSFHEDANDAWISQAEAACGPHPVTAPPAVSAPPRTSAEADVSSSIRTCGSP